MLGYNDKVFLSVSNVMNKEGEKYLINISLPNNFEYIGFPDDVIKVSVYEKEIKQYGEGDKVFNILVGKVSTMDDLFEDEEIVTFSEMLAETDYVKTDDPVCYYKNDDGNCVIFAKIEDGDIVVKDVEELEEQVMDISYDFEKIQRSINKIKKYVYKK
ncbi:MAG: hypothetical protein IJL76_00950 [Bacilli bacterium]|nr:hypothetical protein [Bacilli bacterium]